MGKRLGIRRLTDDDFLDFYGPSKIKFISNYQFSQEWQDEKS